MALSPIRRLWAAFLCLTLAMIAALALDYNTALGASLTRTVRIAPPGVDPNGPSADPAFAANGRYLAFTSQASNLGPVVGTNRVSNIYLFDFLTAKVTLVSGGANGVPANQSSSTPAVSANGQVVAFASQATNLVPGTPKQVSEIFVRNGHGPTRLVSVGFGGVQADGQSSQPVISADGRWLAFTSTADDLIAGDDNGSADIFLADLAAGTLTRVSVSGHGAQANASSYNPSISADGHLVSFTSAASNLVPGDHNHLPDVFVRNLTTGTTRRVSIASNRREQNASIPPPFSQVSNLSADGHYVVFDSNATNLVPGDTNGHTDVFRRDLVSGSTSLVSTNSVLKQGNNDSFSPATSADGRVTVFESFADNLASPWAPNENVFAQDMKSRTTLTVDVTPTGDPRAPELDPQLLQQAAVSADGQSVAFISGANNLVANDFNGADDVFVRVITPTVTTIVQAPPAQTADRRPVVEFRGGNPVAPLGICDLDGHRQMCPVGTPFRLPKLHRGPHVLKLYAGAAGTLFDPQGAVVHFTEL